MKNVLTIILSHQAPHEVELTLELWKGFRDASNLVLAYGGSREDFEDIKFESKLFIDDPQLRVKQQQRNKQSCTGVFKSIGRWLKSHPDFGYVHYVEYDQVPLVKDLYTRLTDRINQEEADVLAYHLQRIDKTSMAHYLYHAYDTRFHRYFSELSTRTNTSIILSMLGTGAFWRREAFEAISLHEEPFPIYMELYLPTLAHHLGYRLRDLMEQNEFVMPLGEYSHDIERLREAGAWMVHPVKRLPLSWSTIIQ